MAHEKIQAVLFDFDGVVVQSEQLHKKTFLELLAPYGVEVDEGRWYREFAGTGSENIFRILVKEHKLDLDVSKLVPERAMMYERRVRNGELKTVPGIMEFLTMLRNRGIKTAIVSGSHRTNVETALEVLGLKGYFDEIVSGDEKMARKPDPEPFLQAAKRLGVRPSACLAMEDSYAGCVAVLAAGMRLVVVKSPAKPPIKRDTIVITDFRDRKLEQLFP